MRYIMVEKVQVQKQELKWSYHIHSQASEREQEVGMGDRTSWLVSRIPFLQKVSNPSRTPQPLSINLPANNQVFKHPSLWGTLDIKTTTTV